MKQIYEYDFLYSFLRHYVDYTVKSSYRKYVVRGMENIPEDGAVILAPNHCNALMDALVVLSSDTRAKVFGARADAFTPLFRKILRFLRILPMVRKRDGLRNVLKNKDTMNIIVEVLENSVPFCMFSEGTHRTKHSLLPLTKGIFRTALAANEAFGDKKPVYIVPVGLEYGDYFRYRSSVIMSVGKPLNVTEAAKSSGTEQEAALYSALREDLSRRMSSLITYIPDNEDYEAKWALIRAVNAGRKSSDPRQTLECNRKVAEIIETHIERLGDVLSAAGDFEKSRKKAGISILSFGKSHKMTRAFVKTALLLAGLPYFLFSGIVTLPMWLTAKIVKKKTKDAAFHNTIKFGIKGGFTPLMTIIWAALAFVFLPWYFAVAALLLCMWANSFIYDYCEFARIFLSDIRLLAEKDLQRQHKSITDEFRNLTDVVSGKK